MEPVMIKAAAGWVNPRESIIAAIKEYLRLGGDIGDVRGLVTEKILEISGGKAKVIGVKTADGPSHRADQLIYATGAFTTSNPGLLHGIDTQITQGLPSHIGS
ncbi:hypothetical protein B0I35DRAFT_485523 [Stachybotrys elegans]|uniref:FAD dependent oxidoreductase domain-containing protein n=1 Tax=Stachybotrys elegans TaxID=80388 RepID=A0A8K0WJI1_9HYPO|nr:hypothetical protein B0I35DRAFT_485523 [Stachybotrys elegans]